ncbi:hypothetical protein E2320_001440 [Naja naja]|nr:hypothetical protein E2320_001440 [Naja naja]
MGAEQEASVPITCFIFILVSGRRSSLAKRSLTKTSNTSRPVSSIIWGMKVSCTHFQCAACRAPDHFPHSYSVDMSHQILNLNINLMLGQAQECLLEKSMLDNRKSFLVARISAQLHMGKQAEEQQKYGERVTYFQSALDKLNEAIRLAKGQPETVQEALRFTLDVIGGKDFPPLGASLVKALPVNPTDPAVTGPDIFAKLVPMAAHEASSLYR